MMIAPLRTELRSFDDNERPRSNISLEIFLKICLVDAFRFCEISSACYWLCETQFCEGFGDEAQQMLFPTG